MEETTNVCGIFGFTRRTPFIERLLPFLAWEIEARGKDSWGVTNGVGPAIRKLGKITESWEDPGWDRAIFHTRAASCGEKTIENQHPFEFDKVDGTGKIIGVHNGIVSNHEALDKKYDRKFDVDSMHIFAHLAEGKEMREICGWGALAYYDGPTMCFARFNMTDFHVFGCEGGLVFCSTLTPVMRAAKMFGVEMKLYQFDGDRHYFVDTNEETGDDVLMRGEPMVFGSQRAPWADADAEAWYAAWDRSHRGWNRSGARGWTDFPQGRTGVSTTSYATDSRIFSRSSKESADEIGKYARQNDLCIRCGHAAARKVQVVCDDCLVQFTTIVAEKGTLYGVWDRAKHQQQQTKSGPPPWERVEPKEAAGIGDAGDGQAQQGGEVAAV